MCRRRDVYFLPSISASEARKSVRVPGEEAKAFTDLFHHFLPWLLGIIIESYEYYEETTSFKRLFSFCFGEIAGRGLGSR